MAQVVAIIGASADPESVSGRPLGYLASGGFTGRVYPVNPARESVQGLRAYRSVLDVPEVVDVAMIVVRAEYVPQALRDCAAAGVQWAVVISSGFGEGGGQGAELRTEIVDLLRSTPLRVVGPNCEGLLSLPNAMPLTFSPAVQGALLDGSLRAGDIAVVSQSGGLGFAVAQWGSRVGLRFNYVITTGNEVDVGALEVIAHLVEDPAVRVVALILEGVADLTRLGSVGARARALGKFLVVAKLGRSGAGARAAEAHTLHDAGSAALYDDVLRRHGVPQTADEEELIDVVQALSRSRIPRGRRIGIVTTSGGAGVWLTDACEAAGLEVPELKEPTQARLSELILGFGSPRNPVDLTAQFFFSTAAFRPVLDSLAASGEVDAVVIVTSLASPGRLEREREGLRGICDRLDMPLLVCTYTRPAKSAVDILDELGLPWYQSSRRVARALAALATAGQWQDVR